MQSPISINYSHKVSQANTKLKTSQPTKFQQFNQISKFIFNSVVKKWRRLRHGRLRRWIYHRLPFYAHGMVGFTWWAMVAAFHVAVMAVAADIAEIAECEEDEKREAVGNRCEGKRKNGFWVIWPSPNQTYIKNPKNPTQAQI